VESIVGIVKAYSTRVGNGPFPTEVHDATGERLRTLGHEYGATTGRPRRCGWFDAFALKYSAEVNGITDVVVTKLDVLDQFDVIRVCVGYELNGKRLKSFPTDVKTLEAVTPVYETFEGWKTSLSSVREFADLPANARSYLRALGELTGTTIWMVSVGPRRDQTLCVPS
jgi:adenylosuccinate synthase